MRISYRAVKLSRISAAFGRDYLRREADLPQLGPCSAARRDGSSNPHAREPSRMVPAHDAQPGRLASGKSALRTPQP
jgi:hypothetical protein